MRVILGLTAMVIVSMTLPAMATAEPLPPGGTFFDDDGHVFEGAIEAIREAGVTVGCDAYGSYFCPDVPVTRYEMATFLVRATGSTPRPPERLTDVTGVHAHNVGALEAAGWVKGCNPPANTAFCGDRPITRAEMATMLTRAFELSPSMIDTFDDDDGTVFEADINAMAASGITVGCDPPANRRFCPTDVVTRGQMAAFLARALHLPTPAPTDAFDGRMVFGTHGASFGLTQLAVLDGTRLPVVVSREWSSQPELSPDAGTISYIDLFGLCPSDNPKSPECVRRLFSIPFEGGARRQLTPDWLDVAPGVDAYIWSPDGETIWLSAGEAGGMSMWSLDVATQALDRIRTIEETGAIVWAPTGLAAAIHDSAQAITVIDRTGGVLDRFSHDNRTLSLLQWSPDGTRLALLSDATMGGVAPGESDILVITPSTGEWRSVARVEYVTHLAWSPDGTRLAYVDSDGTTGAESIHIATLTGGDPDIVLSDIPDGVLGTFDWSPDGDQIAFVTGGSSGDSVIHQIHAVRLSDAAMWPITPPGFWAFSYSWR